MKKEIIVEGAIGNSDRQNRDDYRVLARGGYQLHSEITHRQGTASGHTKSKKIAGEINGHQWGVVYYGSGCSPCMQARDYKSPSLVIKKWKSGSD